MRRKIALFAFWFVVFYGPMPDEEDLRIWWKEYTAPIEVATVEGEGE